jgi:hypothetical protein
VKTAGKIREAQLAPTRGDKAAVAVPEVVQVPLLVELNFGSLEGKKSHKSKSTNKEHNRSERKGSASFVDVESKEALAKRADAFLDKHLLPLLVGDATGCAENCIAIVSHGIFLSTLWKRLLLRLPAKSVVLSPQLQATARPSLEHLGGWSNTGYLDLHLEYTTVLDSLSTQAKFSPPASTHCSSSAETLAMNKDLGKAEVPQASIDGEVTEKVVVEAPPTKVEDASQPSLPHSVCGWTTIILAINSKDHLKGLKRTGGGVGSSRHDDSQKRIEYFFKRRKVE